MTVRIPLINGINYQLSIARFKNISSISHLMAYEDLYQRPDTSASTYKKVIWNYRKGLRVLEQDYSAIENNINNNILAVDFSELFLHMFNSPTSRIDFNLLKYIFNYNKKRDFRMILLPPAIIEIRIHYDYLQNVGGKLMQDYALKDSEELKKIGNLFKKAGNKQPGSEDSAKIQNYWNEIKKKNSDIEWASLLLSGYKKNSLIERAHERLIELFDNNILNNPEDIDVFNGRIQEFNIDQNTYNLILDKLNDKRKNLSKRTNNELDALHAAYDISINNEVLSKESNVLSIFTGSGIPLEIYESFLNIDKKNLPNNFKAVRCPYCLMARIFCENDLKFTGFKKEEFIRGGDKLLTYLYNNPESSEELENALVARLTSNDRDDSIQEMFYLLAFASTFTDKDFSKYLNVGLRHIDYEMVRNEFYNSIMELKRVDELNKLRNLNDLEEMYKIKNIIESIENRSFTEELAKSRKQIFYNSKKVYDTYYKFLKPYADNRLSPFMVEYFEKSIIEPEDPESISILSK